MANPNRIKRGAERLDAASYKKAANVNTRGAARSKISLNAQSKSWIRHHKTTAVESFSRLLLTPLPSLMTLSVLAIALALPGLMFVGLKNIQTLSDKWGGEPRISLYLQNNITEEAAEYFSQTLLMKPELLAVELVSKQQGLHEFQQSSNFADVLSFLKTNPLPAVVIVQPRVSYKTSLAELQKKLELLPEVDEAVLDMVWVERLASYVKLANRLVLVLGGLLILSVLLVVGNTIRLLIESRKDEIQVAKLVGATDAWVRRPFIYTGFWFGLSGAVFAWILIQISLLLTSDSVSQLARLYQSNFQLQGLDAIDSLILLLTGILLGLLGAVMAVGRHLKDDIAEHD